jgi:hypothetical protein
MKTIETSIILILIAVMATPSRAQAQKPEETEDWSRQPEVVTPGKGSMAPSDAIVLYGGPEDLDKWEHMNGKPVQWKAGEALTVEPRSGDIKTREGFGSVQLHIEWRTPEEVVGKGQGRGNSGIFLMGLYEVQVLDSYDNETYYNGQAASIYKQHIPLVNACRPPGEWQAYDIIFNAPEFEEDGSLLTPAYITILHNGVLVQNHVELLGPTLFIGKPKYEKHPEKLPLSLQDHGNPVAFRNIWVRPI